MYHIKTDVSVRILSRFTINSKYYFMSNIFNRKLTPIPNFHEQARIFYFYRIDYKR